MKHLKAFENFKTNGTNLIIVDVQKSFKKYFTDMYIYEVQKYAKQFSNVYVIYDNHYQGKDVDPDYLYDEVQDDLDDDEVYDFKDGQILIEKRYNYNVNVDFYRKILDEKTYNDIKNKEKNNQLKIGEVFPTTQGTAIVFVNNNHKWFHIGKALYQTLVQLKNQQATIIGGSSWECLKDVKIAAQSLGVKIVENKNYIYSATFCPIK
jgi:hypothetical protein